MNGEFTPPAPYKLVDNAESLLDKTDLVFIDAMGTGYSRAAGKAQEGDFYGIDEDAAAFAQFIVTYISRNNRWNSPKFLIGESYGTFRSAVLGNVLQQRYSVHLNGICLISSVLDLSTLTFAPGDDRRVRVLPAELRRRRVVLQGREEPAGESRAVSRGSAAVRDGRVRRGAREGRRSSARRKRPRSRSGSRHLPGSARTTCSKRTFA